MIRPRSHAEQVMAEIDAENERQRQALAKFYERERPTKVPAPTFRALAIFFGIVVAGVILIYSMARWWPI